MDPLTDDYPELTNYQYADNDPIANIDLDGLEGFNSLQTLETVTIKLSIKTAPAATSLATKLITRLALITAKGVSDALVNANTIGVSDGLFGTNRLDSYDEPGEKAAYLRGRLGGDAIAIAQSADEVSAGGGIALTTGAQTFGAGAAAGLAVGLHGAGVGATAASDAAWATKKLYEINRVLSSATDVGESVGSTEYTQPPDTKRPKGSYKEVKGNMRANEEARKYGYKDAHDLKKSSDVGKGNEAKFNIFKDSKTGKLELRDIKTEKIRIPVYHK